MIRRPTRSTLLPSTTLFRPLERQARHVDDRAGHVLGRHPRLRSDAAVGLADALRHRLGHVGRGVADVDLAAGDAVGRSEEHTSELQSRQYIVCRLLLEKTKT